MERSARNLSGLSPRVRGNRGHGAERSQPVGSIPACAGEPYEARLTINQIGVYPRVCGGTLAQAEAAVRDVGLSPRVRGNPGLGAIYRPVRGSIPACAGEPPRRRRWRSSSRVYPRVCGGTIPSLPVPSTWTGLSPRVRGNRRPGHLHPRQRGSIPACAGEPRTRTCAASPRWVYPRVCGGTASPDRDFEAAEGLSPRVRGNRRDDDEGRARRGSIPACAGEPRLRQGDRLAGRVYPRVCGGTVWMGTKLENGLGLSPRVRGNQAVRDALKRVSGSIPACAGEPR